MSIINQYIEGDYIVVEYESGAKVRYLASQNLEETIEIPPNPLLQLQQENAELKERIEIMQQALDDLILGGV
ncbi:hypothetical protein GFC29_3140 [Anoxybacillus sp. B7M1]|uniref:hypothetical protein n=1 Tax=unclassified Anoxybacillus TaxID=2639704 RepID=UPI0005CCA977|nr:MULTISPECIES: hypothetical protein [unclassified Anoxybacillus]ANB58883.1 hypothetical protein GFC28_2296 [Anoxybacillus sp. B2M1]ANB62529.1 hypothetical protein GFC29_3140 [Anoxybacillus sp. B7M1]